MKIQIIYLDPQDDYGAARDKLNWAKAPRVVLVWPGRGRVLARQLDLVLLQRYASNHGTAIGLVTHDPEVREHASVLGIPVFDTLDHVSEGSWFTRSKTRTRRTPEKSRVERPTPIHREKPASSNKLVRSGILVITFFALLLLGASLIPTANVYLSPEEELQSFIVERQVDFSSSTRGRDNEALRQETVIVDGSLRGPTSGLVDTPVGFAEGVVIFSNRTDGTVTVPPGTIILTEEDPEIEFMTQQSIELDAEEGAEGSARVRAILPGSRSNVEAEVIHRVDGQLGQLVSVRNPEEITGGTEETRSAVAPSDIVELREALTEKLYLQAEEILSSDLSETEELLPDSWRTVRVIDEIVSDADGDAADTTSISMSVETSVVIIDKPRIEASILNEGSSQIPAGHVIIPGTLKLMRITTAHDAEGEIQKLSLQVELSTRQEWNPEGMIDLIKLKPVDAAKNILFSQYALDQPPKIIVRPIWLPILPWLNLSYDIHYPQAGSE